MMLAVDTSEIHRLSNEEFQQMVEQGAIDEMRVELIDGFLCDMTPPSPEHENVIVYLNRLLATCVDQELFEVRPQMGLTIGPRLPSPT